MDRISFYGRRSFIGVTVALLLVVSLAASGWTAETKGLIPGTEGPQGAAEQEKPSEDPFGRTTPQGTVLGFMKSAQQRDYEQALRYLDTKKTGVSAQKLVVALQAALDRGFSRSLGLLSNKPEGSLDDNLPASQERVGKVDTPSGSFDILLERVQRGKEPPIWVFSSETLKELPDHYGELKTRDFGKYIPSFLLNTWFLWFPLWQWFTILLIIPLSFGLATLLTRLLAPLFALLVHRVAGVRFDQHVVGLSGPLRILIFALAIWIISLLSRSVLTSAFWAYVASTLTVAGLTWLCIRSVNITFGLKQKQLLATSSGKISILQLARKLTVIMVAIAGAFIMLYLAGINLAAVLTGLGVGGIAVAFAAQKTLENLFGGIMIASDQPIRVGDFCRAGEYMGTVEEVGLRSTCIRTLSRTVVSIPNGQLALMNLENFTLRDKTWFHHTIQLRYETPSEQLRYVLAEMRKMLYAHPKTDSSSARVRFVGFGNSSLDLEVFAYVPETDFGAFLKVQEDLLLRIMEIVEESGSGFAFPSQTTYIAKDSGLDGAKSEEAIATVRQWREKGELPFPDFAPEKISEMSDKLEYPPSDSAVRGPGA
jgi:MscS family membrane protein